MSKQYPGGIISKTAPVPSGPYADSTAPGIWTLEQQAALVKQGNWPTAGNANPNAFIENLFSTYLWTGNDATQTITNGINLSANDGLVWIKSRNATYSYILSDTVRGTGKFLSSNTTDAQGTDANDVTAFNTTGFTVGNNARINNSSFNYVGWTFREQPKFFDIVTWSGNGTGDREIPHNLGSVPGCIILKSTSTGGTSWFVYHRGTSNPNFNYTRLNLTNATATSGDNLWNVTSTTFRASSVLDANNNGQTFVAYLFAHDAGGFGLTGTDNVISCGSFSTSGGAATVTLGYEPQWILWKRTDASQNWNVYDNMRGWAQKQVAQLYPNLTQVEDIYTGSEYFFPTATGFQLNSSFGLVGDYIYITIRRGPMKVPTSATTVFSPITNSATTGTVNTTGFPVDMGIVRWRTGTDSNFLRSRLQGVSSTTAESGAWLKTNTTDAESTSGGLTRLWDNTGFQTTSGFSTYSTVYWNFGRAPGFFDEVCWTSPGSSSNERVAHNLGVAPELIFMKQRNGSNDWWTYNAPQGRNFWLTLNTTSASNSNTNSWGTSNPTATDFGFAADYFYGSSTTNVAYLFATCAGVSKVGSYTGTGATQTINCGFTGGSRFVLIKRTDSTGDWYVWDSARGIIPSNDPYLLLNSTAAEVTGTDYIDTTSVGFDITSTAPAGINANGGTYIFLAIA